MSFLRSFIEAINGQIEANICEKNACFYSLTQPGLLRNGKRKPVAPGPVEMTEIMPDDRKPIQIYHRLLGIVSDPRDGLGDDYSYYMTWNMRLFGVAVINKTQNECYGMHDDLGMEVWGSIPREGTWIASGLKGIRFRIGNLNSDSRAIISSEFSGLDENRVNASTVYAFSIDYTISGYLCADLCDVSDVTYTT